MEIANADLNEISNLEGLNVWGQTQETLEEQALKELEIFADQREEGEVTEDCKDEHTQIRSSSLDVDSYIKRQEELNKTQKRKRSLQISEKSKEVAERISNKKKLKLQELKIKKEAKCAAKRTETKIKHVNDSDSEYLPSDEESSATRLRDQTRALSVIKRNKLDVSSEKVLDDGSKVSYKKRLDEYYKRLENEMAVMALSDVEREIYNEDVEISDGFKMSAKIWTNLYRYQQDGVEWLLGLHQKSTGGLLGDEMGLGKTVQIIAFLCALNYSRIVSRYCRYTGLGPSIVVCPTTVIHQWVQHFHEWAPEFRVAVLHQSGSFKGNKTQLIKEMFKTKGILVTSYLGILKYKTLLTDMDWHYIILDEGHKIRNPSAKVSVAVREFRTPHKIMLTGSPMQNNLQELWSLFDFTNPGMLGTLQVFLDHFANPIMQGGYANATPMQEATALSMATALKNLIMPYLLRRTKAEVRKDISLPHKSEQVLFCSLTDEQRDLYKGFLMSEHIGTILGRGTKNWFSENRTRANVLVAITTLRKICNHPDIYLGEADDYDQIPENERPLEDKYGYYKRSGKMVVVSALLKIWKKQKHRVLLFTQSRAVITIFEKFLQEQEYKYLKMDGSTNISSRQTMIDSFNHDISIDVFLLTTRVGGLGVNLTGADRVIIYDPDWNPATDTQARERAWRIGQEKQVTIYRLLSAGTIEEKIYQRQVWKQLLSNKVLLDPKTQKFFKTSDLHDLFSFQEQIDSNPETANIFQNSRVSLQERIKTKKTQKPKKSQLQPVNFSEDKIQQMKLLAQQISKNIGKSETTVKPKRKQPYELEEEAEKERKKQEKAYLKSLTLQGILDYNREKLLQVDDSSINKIDDFDTKVSFTTALEISEKSSKIYHEMKEVKVEIDDAQRKYDSLTDVFVDDVGMSARQKRKYKTDVVVDKTGTVEGEKIDGLLKSEIKKNKTREKEKVNSECQDDYVLEKLFSKKGVHTALKHDVIVDCTPKDQPNRLRMHSEAQSKADLALEAIRKSRVNGWRW